MRTIILGASPDPGRYSNRATLMMLEYGYEVIPLGIRSGEIGGMTIENLNELPPFKNIHTISIYLNPRNQVEWYQYLLDLRPRRIIFNPGAENHELTEKAAKTGIQTLNACTLVMLATNTYAPTEVSQDLP